jgi:hypothetical protein
VKPNQMKSESDIKIEVRLRLSKCGIVIFNSPTAAVTAPSGKTFHVGLCRGASDLIGIRKRDGRMVAVEVKTPEGLRRHASALAAAWNSKTGSRLNKDQQHAFEQQLFIDLIKSSNGIAGFVTSADEAEELVT